MPLLSQVLASFPFFLAAGEPLLEIKVDIALLHLNHLRKSGTSVGWRTKVKTGSNYGHPNGDFDITAKLW